MKNLMLITIFLLTLTVARAEPLRVVEVGLSELPCIFNAECKFDLDRADEEIPLPAAGKSFLKTLMLTGKKGSPAAGMYGYIYQVDLYLAVAALNVPCVTSLTVDFGDVVNTLDYNGDGQTGDEVFVIFSRASEGDVGLASARKKGRNIIFKFKSPVCTGSRPESGQRSLYFGLVSGNPPRPVTAILGGLNTSYNVRAFAPKEENTLPQAPEPNLVFVKPPNVLSQPPVENPIHDAPGMSAVMGDEAAGKSQPVVSRLAPRPCVDRGGIVTIYGSGFGHQQGTRRVGLGGHGIGVLLRVRSWSDTKITAVIPDNPRIEFGQWYYIGLQNQDRNWISNISRTINICRRLE